MNSYYLCLIARRSGSKPRWSNDRRPLEQSFLPRPPLSHRLPFIIISFAQSEIGFEILQRNIVRNRLRRPGVPARRCGELSGDGFAAAGQPCSCCRASFARLSRRLWESLCWWRLRFCLLLLRAMISSRGASRISLRGTPALRRVPSEGGLLQGLRGRGD